MKIKGIISLIFFLREAFRHKELIRPFIRPVEFPIGLRFGIIIPETFSYFLESKGTYPVRKSVFKL